MIMVIVVMMVVMVMAKFIADEAEETARDDTARVRNWSVNLDCLTPEAIPVPLTQHGTW